jgi:coenzyme F420 biosynthesis associated uncharacterized protein
MTPPTGMVDWDLAVATANRLLSPGPEVSRSEAAAAVTALRRCADVADEHVRAVTRLSVAGAVPPTRIVDRPSWVKINATGMSRLLTPLVEKLEVRRPSGRITQTIGPRATGLQAGALLAFLSGKVLGQFEFFAEPTGQLLLVAPNVVEAERSLTVDPGDFRLWVCLHEVTHRLQFTAVPWLRGYLVDEIDALVEATDLDPEALRERLAAASREIGRIIRGEKGSDPESRGLLGLVETPAQRAVMDRLTAYMSLIEGHAEYVMNAVGPDVIPSLPRIREKFQRRRQGTSRLDRLLRRVLGLDVKLRQYAEGSKFVGGVVDVIGMDGFNAVWTSPETLPRRTELAHPLDWVERVHGFRPAASA